MNRIIEYYFNKTAEKKIQTANTVEILNLFSFPFKLLEKLKKMSKENKFYQEKVTPTKGVRG
ncbi:MAG: hypothetical protein D6813_01415 [Calditrichaeota bacterium]|nr:MAG: hypothetical protein D6813_01415 [Calditrichota bacterium]